jgi:hypothetical protein
MQQIARHYPSPPLEGEGVPWLKLARMPLKGEGASGWIRRLAP